MAEHCQAIKDHPTFVQLLDKLRFQMEHLDTPTLAYIFLCLRKIGIDMTLPVIQELFVTLQKSVPEMDPTAISYYCVSMKNLVMQPNNIYFHERDSILSTLPLVRLKFLRELFCKSVRWTNFRHLLCRG